jgi:hypothetical protein
MWRTMLFAGRIGWPEVGAACAAADPAADADADVGGF